MCIKPGCEAVKNDEEDRQFDARDGLGAFRGAEGTPRTYTFVTSGEVIGTPFFALRTSSSARLLFSPVSFSLFLPWFHLPSNHVVSNTIHAYR